MQQHHDDAPKSDSQGGHCRTQEYASSMVSDIDRRKGLSATAAAEVFWGLTPIYWKAVATVSTHELLALRVLWAIPFTTARQALHNIGRDC